MRRLPAAAAVLPPHTRQRIFDVALQLFAEQGFRRVTVRDICREAGANVAAVNYHFGGKMGLYTEVLDTAVSAIQTLTAQAVHLGEGHPAEAQLATYVRVYVERLFAPASPEGLNTTLVQQLIHREIQDPTPALEALIERAFRPRFEYLGSIISRLLGTAEDDPRVIQCAMSVNAQVLTFRPSPLLDRMRDTLKGAWDVEQVIAHVTAFSLAGIASYAAVSREP